VLPDINKFKYREKCLDQVIGTDRGFFRDDLYPASDICSDASGACFARAVSGTVYLHADKLQEGSLYNSIPQN